MPNLSKFKNEYGYSTNKNHISFTPYEQSHILALMGIDELF